MTGSFEPGAAEQCAQACSVYVQGLEVLRARVLNARSFTNGFGTLQSGVALGNKFASLSSHDLPKVIAQHIEVATRLKSVFEAAGRAYEQTESHTTATILASED